MPNEMVRRMVEAAGEREKRERTLFPLFELRLRAQHRGYLIENERRRSNEERVWAIAHLLRITLIRFDDLWEASHPQYDTPAEGHTKEEALGNLLRAMTIDAPHILSQRLEVLLG